MAQSEATVTVVSPSPPTNFLSVFGGTPPTTAGLAFTDDGAAAALNVATPPTNGTPHECAGSIVTVTAPGSRTECPTQSISDLGNYTVTPNGSHASMGTPAVAPTITSLAPTSIPGVGGVADLVVNGTGFQPGAVVNVGGVPMPTQFNSATQLRVLNAPKKASSGNVAITVTLRGTTTAATNWVFT